MRRALIYSVITLLIISEIFLLKTNCSLRTELTLKNAEIFNLIKINETLKPQYVVGIRNVGMLLSSDIELKDVYGNVKPIKEQIHSIGNKALICIISDRYCDECTEYAISKIEDLKRKYNADNVIFLSENVSQNTFKMFVDKFDLHNTKIFRCQSLGIPADNIMTPYCIAVDSTLAVLGIYVPNKISRYMEIDSLNIDMLYNKCAYIEMK